VAPYELPVLITGESGVGKERFADAIQTLSDRAQAPYVKVNCGALSPGLIESELFGHKKGAFTGATQDRKGRVEEATGGTLLLDEIGELPLSLQVKLLRTLQQGEVQRLGEDRPRQVDVRVIAATNRDIESDVANGHFREDLYYRLAGVRLHVPPLRERRLDIPLLAAHFLERFGEESARRGRPKRVGALLPEAEADLVAREWRGNVRELENVLRLAWIRVPPDASIDREALAGQGPPPREPTPVSLADAEDVAIRKAMERSGGNVAAAARLLGIDRTTLWRKLKKGSGY
jgi:two-component system response regulator HydG